MISLLLAAAVFFGCLPLAATAESDEKTADDITGISVVATKETVEGVGGSFENFDDPDQRYDAYNIYSFQPRITVTYTDGTNQDFTLQELFNRFGFGYSAEIEQSGEHPLGPAGMLMKPNRRWGMHFISPNLIR